MKRSLDHLPEEHQLRLKHIASYVNHEFDIDVDMIILFGSFARGNWVDDTYIDEHGTGYSYKSDYDLLFIVPSEKMARNNKIKNDIRDRVINEVGADVKINIIFHGIKYLNKQIEESSYFFVDIYNDGILLYDNGAFELAKPKVLSPEMRYKKAIKYFEEWFDSADTFFENSLFNIKKAKIENYPKYSKSAMFNLHQTTERLFTATLLVFRNYKEKTHDLEKLYNEIKKFDPRFKIAFPLESQEEKDLFIKLRDAYVDARYDIDYSIEIETLEYLEERVKVLIELTEKICKEKIGEMGKRPL